MPDDRQRLNDKPFNFHAKETVKKYICVGVGMKDPAKDIPTALESEQEDKLLSNALQRIRNMIHYFLNAMDKSTDKNMMLTADIFRIVVGEGSPPSMTKLSKIHRMTKQNISHRCRKLLDELELNESAYMRSSKSVLSMKRSAILRVKRNKKRKLKRFKRWGTPPPVRNLFDPPATQGASSNPTP